MYPISDQELSFSTVAHEWWREMPRDTSLQAVRTNLLSAIWAGRLVIRKPSSGEPMPPQELLQLAAKTKSHYGFLIEPTGGYYSHSSKAHPDGSVSVALFGHIALPDDPSQWTETQVRDAIAVLEPMAFYAFADNFRAGVSCMEIRRDDFAMYCHAAGYPLPVFWFRNRSARVPTAKAESECERWLRSLTRKPNGHPKAWYREESYRRFPGLSLRAFDRAWSRATPPTWQQAGARRKAVAIRQVSS
jgi:hypothetical protein